MKFLTQARTLPIAVAVSITAHAALLAVRFTAPDAFRFQPADPGLEVILVNAKHDRRPVKADAVAQANLDGGGNADAGRAKSPLPDMGRMSDGDSIKRAQQRVEELQELQRKLMSQMKTQQPFRTARSSDVDRERETPRTGVDAAESSQEIARTAAEIAKNIEDYNKRPKKTQITPTTREAGYAMYYKALQEKVEKVGTFNFPQQNGRKLYGELIVYIPIYQDGTLYMHDGGPRVERSSGNAALDKAALDIVRRSAPFGRFPNNMRSTDKDDVWEVITRFRFTREDALQTQLGGAQ